MADDERRLQLGSVRLVRNPVLFRAAFAKYDDYSENGWSDAKHERIGKMGVITELRENGIVIVEFDDGQQYEFPDEAIGAQLTRWETIDNRRHFAFGELRSLVERMNDEEDVDAFDLLALDPESPPNPFISNHMRACVCFVVQLFVPIAVGVSLLYRIIIPEGHTGPPAWGNLCDIKESWTGERLTVKLINKFVASVLALYTYQFLNTRVYLWKMKPTYRLLKKNLSFAVMRRPVWSAIGVITNAVALAMCGVVSVIVIYSSETPIDTVLNSVALYFIVDIDDLLVDKYDFNRLKSAMTRILEASRADKDMAIATELPTKFRWLLMSVSKLLLVVKFLVLLSPVYIVTCKGLGFEPSNRVNV